MWIHDFRLFSINLCICYLKFFVIVIACLMCIVKLYYFVMCSLNMLCFIVFTIYRGTQKGCDFRDSSKEFISVSSIKTKFKFEARTYMLSDSMYCVLYFQLSCLFVHVSTPCPLSICRWVYSWSPFYLCVNLIMVPCLSACLSTPGTLSICLCVYS